MRVKGVGIGRVQHKAQKLGRLHNGLLLRATVASHLSVLLAAASKQTHTVCITKAFHHSVSSLTYTRRVTC